jgi:hypothetical protein
VNETSNVENLHVRDSEEIEDWDIESDGGDDVDYDEEEGEEDEDGDIEGWEQEWEGLHNDDGGMMVDDLMEAGRGVMAEEPEGVGMITLADGVEEIRLRDEKLEEEVTGDAPGGGSVLPGGASDIVIEGQNSEFSIHTISFLLTPSRFILSTYRSRFRPAAGIVDRRPCGILGRDTVQEANERAAQKRQRGLATRKSWSFTVCLRRGHRQE